VRQAERTTRFFDGRGRLGGETTHRVSLSSSARNSATYLYGFGTSMDPAGPAACPPAYDIHACPWLDLDSPLTPYEVLKLVVLSPLAVVRALWMLVTWLIVGCMSWLICLGLADDVPLPPLRYGASDAGLQPVGRATTHPPSLH
jgi:hypothetical protein